jgi:hypothetical protein
LRTKDIVLLGVFFFWPKEIPKKSTKHGDYSLKIKLIAKIVQTNICQGSSAISCLVLNRSDNSLKIKLLARIVQTVVSGSNRNIGYKPHRAGSGENTAHTQSI